MNTRTSIRESYAHTQYACFIAYITQAIVNNYAPLLFLTFRAEWGLSLPQVTALIVINFSTQLLVDMLSSRYADRIGHRVLLVAAHISAASGMAGLAVFPAVFPSAWAGLVSAVVLCGVGGGLIEVLVSPVIEACPTEKKEQTMSLLHSFYCWGQVSVVLISTAWFALFGIRSWWVLACCWAAIPLFNGFLCALVPLNLLVESGAGLSLRKLLRSGRFWLLFALMICSGASEQGMIQWASAFAEEGLGISKTVGDLAGPCAFGVLMGLSRSFYAKFGDRIRLEKFMSASGLLCVASYLLAAFSPYPPLSLFGCALCGLSVGIMWPGTFSLSARAMPLGGTAMFALLALAGDVGCFAGPAAVGAISNLTGGRLQSGMAIGAVFPVVLVFFVLRFAKRTSQFTKKAS